MQTHPDQPAFPIQETDRTLHQPGMSVRVYLAGMAMQGLLTQHQSVETESGARDLEPIHNNYYGRLERCVCDAVQLADMLIAELNKENS